MTTIDNLLDGTATTKEAAAAFIEDPLQFFEMSYTKMQTVPRDKLIELQTEALKQRFDSCKDTIPMLTKLAGKQGITSINEIDDVLPLMFEHNVYKSYPGFLLETGDYGKLTQWLNRLTPYDLSDLDCSACDSIHSWMDTIAEKTDLDPITSSGTTGTMSFTPKDRKDWRTFIVGGFRCQLLQKFGEPPTDEDLNDKLHVCWPGHSDGHTGFYRSPVYYKEYFALGSEDHFHPLMDTTGDTDLMYLAARLRAAQARGDSRPNVPESLLARRDELGASEAERPKMAKAWVEKLVELDGERVFLMAPSEILYAVAKDALAEGKKCNFAPNSSVQSASGNKGGNPLPDDAQDVIDEFLNFDGKYGNFYSFSEQLGVHVRCEHSRLHLAPWSIPYILDPDTSELLPREGKHRGRAAFFDIAMNGAWGGLITGDSVEIDWSECPCGRTTPHLSDSISRLSEAQGGSDKISCTATPEASNDAMDFLTSF